MEIYALLGRNDLKGTITKPGSQGPHDRHLLDRLGKLGIRQLLAHLGSLDDTRDIKIVPLGNMMAIIAGLKTNRVDTVTLWEPGITMALAEKAGYSIIDLVDPAQHEIHARPESMVEVILAKEDWSPAKQDMMHKFFAAQNEAFAWIHSTPMDESPKWSRRLSASSTWTLWCLRSSATCPEFRKSPRWTSKLQQHDEDHGRDRSVQGSDAVREIGRQPLRRLAVIEAAFRLNNRSRPR